MRLRPHLSRQMYPEKASKRISSTKISKAEIHDVGVENMSFHIAQYLTILTMITASVSSGGYIINQTVENDLILNGGTSQQDANSAIRVTVCPDGCNYTSIQAAINNALPRSVIEVQSGTYYENLSIYKPLHFKSVGGRVNYLGTIRQYGYPVTFSKGNYFALIDLNLPSWHSECESCQSFEEFIDCYQDAIQADPSNPVIWRDYAVDLKEIWQRYDEALKSIDSALEIDPKYSEAWQIKAVLLNKLGRYQEAIDSCEKSLKLDPFDGSAWTEKGYALYQMGSHYDANRCFDEAILRDSNNSVAWASKANALCIMGKYNEAVRAYDEAIRLSPQDQQLWNNKGYALDNLGKYDEAIEAYEESIRINPNYPSAWKNKGETLNRLGRIAEADAAFARAKELGYVG